MHKPLTLGHVYTCYWMRSELYGHFRRGETIYLCMTPWIYSFESTRVAASFQRSDISRKCCHSHEENGVGGDIFESRLERAKARGLLSPLASETSPCWVLRCATFKFREASINFLWVRVYRNRPECRLERAKAQYCVLQNQENTSPRQLTNISFFSFIVGHLTTCLSGQRTERGIETREAIRSLWKNAPTELLVYSNGT